MTGRLTRTLSCWSRKMAPETISHYRIVRLLGAGGMGRVYLAEDTLLGRPVALKRLSAGSIDGSAARQQLIKEARAAAVLNHPNIAVVHDVIEDGEDSYIVMEYVDGETLRRSEERRVGKEGRSRW